MAASKARVINGETTLTVNMLSIGEGAFSIDQRQRIVSWNETATQLLGYTGEEVLGKP
ncbi:MAG: PAS domain-containing protein, partial [Ktedonobacterales bacterium]